MTITERPRVLRRLLPPYGPLTARPSQHIADRLALSPASKDASAQVESHAVKSVVVAIRFRCHVLPGLISFRRNEEMTPPAAGFDISRAAGCSLNSSSRNLRKSAEIMLA
jgi:hypothetical protein